MRSIVIKNSRTMKEKDLICLFSPRPWNQLLFRVYAAYLRTEGISSKWTMRSPEKGVGQGSGSWTSHSTIVWVVTLRHPFFVSRLSGLRVHCQIQSGISLVIDSDGCWECVLVPRVIAPKYHKLDDLNQQKCIPSQSGDQKSKLRC